MPSTSYRSPWVWMLPVLALAALPACHRQEPPPAPTPVVATQAEVPPSAIRLNTLNSAYQLTEEQREFLDALQPLILRQNLRLEAKRHRLESLAANYLHTNHIDEADFNWLKNTADEYNLRPKSRSDGHFFDELLARVDVVPPSLVLAHVALSAGWPGGGDSLDTVRFRHHVCHLQFCINQGEGGRSSLNDPPVQGTERAIAAYIYSLNTSPAYAEFRSLRSGLRLDAAEPDGLALAPSLKGRSAVGNIHLEDLELMISANHLQDKD